MIKIKEYKVRKHGARTLAVTLPPVWVDDSKLAAGDRIEVYRDDSDRLILVKKEREIRA